MIILSKIKTTLLIFSCLVTLFCTFGCRSTIIVNGESFMTLTDEEISKLVDRGRFTLQKNRKIFSIEEIMHANKTQPKIDIEYHGDTSGVAKISWQFPRRTVILNFKGDLSHEVIDCMMEIVRPQPEMIKANANRTTPKVNNFRSGKTRK